MAQMKGLDELITTQKTQNLFWLTFFGKKETWLSKGPTNMIFFYWFFSKLVMFIGLLKAYMKGNDQLNLMQKKLTLFDVPFWKH